jgi:RimJ/RimL family protein N-acetyltransferase
MREPPELITERLRMRAPLFEDYDRWVEIFRHPEVGAGLGKPEGLTPHEAWIDLSMLSGHWTLRGFGHWVLEELDGGAVVGRAGLYHPPDWPGIEVGWTVAPEHWGKGYAPEAARAVCAWAHDVLGICHILSLIHPGNERSIRVAEKLGEKLEDHHRARGFELLVYGCDLPLGEAGTRAP